MSATRPWVDAFADLMEQKLASCRDAPELWASEDAQSLAQRIAYVARDLNDDWERARIDGPWPRKRSVRMRTALIGTLAMMLADVAGGMKPKEGE